MATLSKHLTSISPGLQSGPSPGRRLLAVVLCAMLSFSAVLPGLAAAEADSEGEGIASPVEAPAPDFDPGGEETALEEAPAPSGSEEGAEEPASVEAEPELDPEVPVSSEAASVVVEAPVDETEQQSIVPGVESAPAEAKYAPQQANAPEPVQNRSLQAPRQPRAEHDASSSPTVTTAAADQGAEGQAIPVESPEDVPGARDSSANHDLSLAGKRFYVVRPGDCLWHIAISLLGSNATTVEIEETVEKLWRLNEVRIGTGNPNLIHSGTALRLY